MRKLVCKKIEATELCLIYVAIRVPLIRFVNTYSYAKAFLKKLKERIVFHEEYEEIGQATFSIFLENGRYGVSIKLVFLPQTGFHNIIKAITIILDVLFENLDIEQEIEHRCISKRYEDELINLKPAMAVEMSFRSNKYLFLEKISCHLVKRSVVRSISILYTSNMPGELEQYFERWHRFENVRMLRNMRCHHKGDIYVPSSSPCCMLIAFPKMEGKDYFEWKVVESLLSVLLFEVARMENGMVYDLSCNLDLTNNILCVQAGLGRKDVATLKDIVDNLCSKIINENYACEKLKGIKLIQITAFAQLWDSPEDLIDAYFILSYYGLNQLTFEEIERIIEEITWESVKERIGELDFSFTLCSG